MPERLLLIDRVFILWLDWGRGTKAYFTINSHFDKSASLMPQMKFSHDAILEGCGFYSWSSRDINVRWTCCWNIDAGRDEVRGKIALICSRVEVKITAVFNGRVEHSIIAKLERCARCWVINVTWAIGMSASSARSSTARASWAYYICRKIAHALFGNREFQASNWVC